MGMTFNAHRDAYTSVDMGVAIKHKELNNTFESPLIPGVIGSACLGSLCYIINQNWRGKWYVQEVRVNEVVYRHGWWYRFSNGIEFDVKRLGDTIFLHDELDKAKEECFRRNKMHKVKVKYYR